MKLTSAGCSNTQKVAIVCGIAFALSAGSSSAQSLSDLARASPGIPVEAHAVAGAGGVVSRGDAMGGALTVGAGVEPFITDRVSIGGGVGVAAADGSGFLDISITGRARLGRNPLTRRVTPFVAGGYSYLTTFYRGVHAMHVGGGLDYRVSPRRALRIEFRDLIHNGYATSNFLSVRVGMVFRSR